MNNLLEYFQTDWSAMTLQDWIGLTITVIVFVLMVGLYVLVFLPRNRDSLESQRHIVIDEQDAEDKRE